MLLIDYLESQGKTVADGARELGYPHNTVRRWAKGIRRPRKAKDLKKIAEWSNGAVTVNDFFSADNEAA